MSEKEFLTPNEVAKELLVSPITVRQWAQKGLLKAQTTAGGHRRFSRTVVREFALARGMRRPQARPRLLVVDDNRQLNNYLQALFGAEAPGVDVYAAHDGFEAGRLVQQHRPDVVLLDVMMPGIDGIEVCRSLKNQPETAHVRVIGMTGYFTPEVEARMLAAGAQVLLKKPFANAEVLEACGFAAPSGEVSEGIKG